MNVLVYTGPGTARGPVDNTLLTLKSLLSAHYDVIPVDADTLLKEPWQDTAACLVIPGGRDLPYVEHLEPQGTSVVNDYVRGGGRFLGICAGAYFACRRVEFEVGREGYEVVGKRDLGFWPGTGKGSIAEGFVYGTEQGAKAVGVRVDTKVLAGWAGPEDLPLYVNGGPWFALDTDVKPEDQPNVLAWYTDSLESKTSKPAIVECAIEKGRAILSGPHIEYRIDTSKHSDPDVQRILEPLSASESLRVQLVRKLLERLGLKLNEEQHVGLVVEDILRPKLSVMHLCSDGGGRRSVEELLDGLCEEKVGHAVEVEDSVNVLRFQRSNMGDEAVVDDLASMNIADHDDAKSDVKPTVNIIVHSPPSLPSPQQVPKFDLAYYFSVLARAREDKRRHGASEGFGSSILYGKVVGSTQTLLERNLKLASKLPNGFVCVATHQIAGRGRGRNSWISQIGCLMFSFALEHSDARSVIFVQYLVGLAIVEAVRSRPGCEDLPVHLKWPNDIYARTGEGPEGLKKIGGILVSSHFSGGAFRMVIGCGLNVTNPHPTVSLDDVIRSHARRSSRTIAPIRREEVLGRFMVCFEDMYKEFVDAGRIESRYAYAFEPFLERYYSAWLHSNQLVTLGSLGHALGRITGIDKSGLLRAVVIEGEDGVTVGQECLLQPDGNSFDMMRGLITRKL
ncbi:hypothetical protein SpCBS45565_g02331 [Spizellomyces sp. 'palustris']|nr:hypothetical protein SpCBS45565_g02331 [Spizellomyces sp. 'palustris']